MVAGAGIGETPSPAYLMTVRFAGVELLGLGLIAWLVRNAEASKARDGATLGFTLYFALHALTSLYVQLTAVYTAFGWAVIVIQGLFGVGFFMAGKVSMSTGLVQSASSSIGKRSAHYFTIAASVSITLILKKEFFMENP